MTRVQRPSIPRVATSLAAAVALFAVVPRALAEIGRNRYGSANPLAGVAAPWHWNGSDIRRSIAEPLRDDAVVNLIVRTSLMLVWAAIAVIAVSVIVELVHMRRHHGMATPRVRGLGWSQRIARWVAAGLIGLMPISSFNSLASAAPPDRPDAPRLQQAWPSQPQHDTEIRLAAEVEPTPTSAPTPSSAVHVVERGESVYAIAAALSGGDDRTTIELADRILDLNLGNTMRDGEQFSNPALILPGWELDLPDGIGPTTTTRSTPEIDGAGIESETRTHILGEHVVSPGDSLSSIAAAHLGHADDWPLVWDANNGATMVDGAVFSDPNVIVPGWRLRLPVPADAHVDTEGTADLEPRTSTEDPAPDTIPASVPEILPTPAPPAPNDATATAEATPVSTSTPQPLPTTTTSTTTTTTVVAAADVEPDDQLADPNEVAPRTPAPLGIEHAALLAAGILAMAGVRRRRRLRASTPHARVPTPPPEVAATERRLRSIDAGERGARIDVATRAIAHQLVTARSNAQIGTMQAAANGELRVRLTADAVLGGPWVGDGTPSQTWTLPAAVPIEMLSEQARQAGNPCHALITIGVDRHGNDVLIDLEAAGLTIIDDIAGHGDDIARAIACGLASSLTSEVAHLVVAQLDADVLLDHPNAHVASSVEAAVLEAADLVGSTRSNERTTFDLRARRTGGEMWEPAVVVFADADAAMLDPSLGDVAPPGHGVAVVAVAQPGAAGEHPIGAHLVADGGDWRLDAFGEHICLVPIGMHASDVADVGQMLDDADQPTENAPMTLEAQRDECDAADAPTFQPMEHDIVVSLVGHVGVTDCHGDAATFERSKTLELIAWLSTHRERATRSAARTALWELDVRDATFANVVSEARRGLARLMQPPEGQEWLARTLNESLPLHDRVVTDADLIRERLEHVRLAPPSHAIDVLRPAAEMIHAMPFAGTNYLWPDADGLTSELVLLATTVSAELASHALSVGDTDLVFWATQRGLAVLPGHEELIGLRMRAHARAGDLAGVRQEWESYERVITADSWSDGEPAPKLLDLRRTLLSP